MAHNKVYYERQLGKKGNKREGNDGDPVFDPASFWRE
jgi:hypothetical protein